MSHETHRETRRQSDSTPRFPDLGLSVWISALAVAKALDAVTTYLGQKIGLVEANPVVAAAFAEWGLVAGLAVTSIVSIAVVIAGVEASIKMVEASSSLVDREIPEHTTLGLRFAGYGIVIFGLLKTGVENAILLGGVIS